MGASMSMAQKAWDKNQAPVPSPVVGAKPEDRLHEPAGYKARMVSRGPPGGGGAQSAGPSAANTTTISSSSSSSSSETTKGIDNSSSPPQGNSASASPSSSSVSAGSSTTKNNKNTNATTIASVAPARPDDYNNQTNKPLTACGAQWLLLFTTAAYASEHPDADEAAALKVFYEQFVDVCEDQSYKKTLQTFGAPNTSSRRDLLLWLCVGQNKFRNFSVRCQNASLLERFSFIICWVSVIHVMLDRIG